ncbi:MAG: glycerophosphodiester phosphodiesterase family protein [Oscillospiraceae bacterium]|nr:glycerophosphodiester phosphodiesterase family protein [Oscillospiraceae bacterium]
MVMCYAHRGFSDIYPENTMLAFEKAIETGCQGIELDVQMSQDGTLFIMHDEAVNRTTSASGFVKDLRREQLLALVSNSTPASATDRPQAIPTLAQYFERVSQLPLITNIELKNSSWYYPGLETAVIRMVRDYGLADRVLLSSFNHASMVLCHELDPDIKTALLLGSQVIGNVGQYALAMHCSYVHPYYRTVTPGLLRSCHEVGVKVNAWTVNGRKTLAEQLELGVDGVITNRPRLALSLIRKA